MWITTKQFARHLAQQAAQHEKTVAELRNELRVLREGNEVITSLLTGQQQEISALRSHVDEHSETLTSLQFLKQRKESDEPWIEVMGGDVDPEKGLQLNLDWNDAFINQLRAQGYKGTTEGSLVGQWLLAVSQSVASEEDDA